MNKADIKRAEAVQPVPTVTDADVITACKACSLWATGEVIKDMRRALKAFVASKVQPAPQQAAAQELVAWNEWRLTLAEKVDEYIQGEYEGEGAGDVAYAELKAHILKTPFAAPEGYQLVPIEPTPEMIEAGEDYVGRYAYDEMLKAAPRSTP